MSFSMRWVCWRQHIVGFFLLFQSVSLYLLIDDFRPLTFKDYYWDTICISGNFGLFLVFNVAWFSFFVGFTIRILPPIADLNCCFHSYSWNILLRMFCSTGFLFAINFNICLLWKDSISFWNLKVTFAEYRFSVGNHIL